MIIVYAKEQFPTTITKSIMLCGPTPRSTEVVSWRPQVFDILNSIGFDGHVFVPEPRNSNWTGDYTDQIEWEDQALNIADAIMFWIPRNMKTMPGLTTNVEFGLWANSGKIILGYPDKAENVRYLQHIADKLKIQTTQTLYKTITQTINFLGEGSCRVDGECYVPLFIWNQSTFQQWYLAQKKVGNRLEFAKLIWSFRVGHNRDKVFCWVLLVKIWVESEKRIKSNEIVISRTDLTACVMYHKDEVVLVREFRSPVRNDKCFVYELPGGSSLKENQIPQIVISHEVEEETGLNIEYDRFVQHETRQSLATFSAHITHLFSVELTLSELNQLKNDLGNVHGVVEDTEQTYVEIWDLKNIRDKQLVDWSNLGMILSVLRPN